MPGLRKDSAFSQGKQRMELRGTLRSQREGKETPDRAGKKNGTFPWLALAVSTLMEQKEDCWQ